MSDQITLDDLPPTDPIDNGSSISAGKYKKALILDEIFLKLVNLIDSLQSVAATQAQRLTFLNQWQAAYTDMMNQIHTFARGSGDFMDGDPEDSVLGAKRDDLNRVNSTYTEELRSKLSIVSDDAKALQSNISQTNDAVTQQTNSATAILEQLATILNSIFK